MKPSDEEIILFLLEAQLRTDQHFKSLGMEETPSRMYFTPFIVRYFGLEKDFEDYEELLDNTIERYAVKMNPLAYNISELVQEVYQEYAEKIKDDKLIEEIKRKWELNHLRVRNLTGY